MRKRETLFLLTPLSLFVGAAVIFLSFSAGPRIGPVKQEMLDKLAERLRRGEVATDEVIRLLQNSREQRIACDAAMSSLERNTHAIGWCMVAGGMLHFYVVFRITYKRRDP